MFLRAANELQLKQWILQAPEGSVYVYTLWGHPCCSVSVYCSLNLQPMHVLLCFTNKLEGNSAQVSCALNHFCQIPALCFPLHQVWRVTLSWGQVQANSARVVSGETGTSTSPEGLWLHRQHPDRAGTPAFHPSLAWVWVCYKIYVMPCHDYLLFSHSWAKLFSLCYSLKWLKSVWNQITVVGFQVQHQLVQHQDNFAAVDLHCRKKNQPTKGNIVPVCFHRPLTAVSELCCWCKGDAGNL